LKALDLHNPENRLLGNVLRWHAENNGDTDFLVADARHLSYSNANAKVNALANGLSSYGIGRGDRVALFMHGCEEFVLLTLAVNRLGAIWVPVNTDYRGDWLIETVNASRAAMLAVDAALLPRVLEARRGLHCGRLLLHDVEADVGHGVDNAILLDEVLSDDTSDPAVRGLAYGDTNAVLWTSGTTGKSKGVMQSHNAWIRAVENSNRMFCTSSGDVVYNCLPMYNSAAWVANIYRALVAGVPCAIDANFSVHDFWDRIRFYGATQTMTLGAMHMFLWNQPAREDDAENPLRMANMVPMPESLIAPFCERFGMEGILQGFGQSEVMLLLSRKDTPEKRWKPNALGELAGGLELRMLDDAGEEVAAGEVGEFCVRETEPHQIFNGYFDDPETTAEACRGGWYHTGDLGMRDADGDYFFVDRKKDVIRYKGRNVSSLQIESIALQHPAVQGAAVYGVRSKELDSEHEIKLDVVLRPGAMAKPEELARFINDRAPYFCVPRYIEFVGELPYTPTNKVQKYRLRERELSAAVWDRAESQFRLER